LVFFASLLVLSSPPAVAQIFSAVAQIFSAVVAHHQQFLSAVVA
jgi:hypothetical protein